MKLAGMMQPILPTGLSNPGWIAAFCGSQNRPVVTATGVEAFDDSTGS